jgi:hypothetical protein
MKEIDQFVGLHRTGEINDAQLVKAVLNVFDEYQHTREMGIDIPPLEPWAKRLQDELDNAKSAWFAERNKLKLPAGMTWGSGTPSYALAILPGLACIGFGLMTLASVAGGALQMPEGWKSVASGGLASGLGLVFCLWFAIKASLYHKGEREYDVKRTRIILRNCQSRYESKPA